MAGWLPASGSSHATSGDTAFKIYAQFSQVLDPNRVNISSFILRLSGSSTNLSGTAFRDTLDTTRAVFVPSSGIFGAQTPATSAWYHPIVLGSGSAVGVRNIEGFFAATVSGSFLTATAAIPPDTTPPVVSGTTPLSGSTGYAISGSPTITFSEDVKSGTCTTTNIKIRVSGGGSDVAATVTLAADLNTVTIDPTANLSGNTIYRGFVHPAIQDLAGNTMAASFTWSFTTVSPTAPTVSGTTPTSGATGYEVSGAPVVVFSTPMQSGSFSGQIKIRQSGAGSDFSSTTTVSSNLTTVKLTPTVMLSHCTLYNIIVHNTVREQLGITPMAASYMANFTTFCPTAPTVSSTDPVSGATAVAIGVNPVIVFSTAMQSGSFSGQIVLQISGGSNASFALTVSSNLLAVQIDPTDTLAYSAPFNVFINNTVKEQLGVTSMAASYTFSFTTTDPTFTSIYNVSPTTFDHHLDNDRFRVGMRVKGGSSMIGHIPKRVVLKMRQEGSPLSGVGTCVLRSNSGSVLQTTFGEFNPVNLSTTYSDVTFTNLSATWSIIQSDRIYVEWVSGTSSNKVGVQNNDTNPNSDEVEVTRDGTTFSGSSWTENSSIDLAGQVYEVV